MSETRPGKDAQSDLIGAFLETSGKDVSRAFDYASSYYGLSGKNSLTLEAIGSSLSPPLTRERIRQIIDAGVSTVKAKENGSRKGFRPFSTAADIFAKMLDADGHSFVTMQKFVSHPYFKSFSSNMKGLSAFVSDVGIRQVVYRGEQYLYLSSSDRKEVIKNIQSVNKKVRRSQTEEKADGMSKTVTYVPSETKTALKKLSKERKLPLNRLYERILTSFSKKSPRSASEYPKTRSWKARKGMAEWVQVGIYIDRDVFEKAKKESEKIGVSLMSYICKSFTWFVEDPTRVD